MPKERVRSESALYKIVDLKAAKKILMLIDGYRKLNIEDFEWADKEVKDGKMGKRFSQDWKQIRELMLKFAREAGSQRHLLDLAALQQILLQVGLVVSAITTLLTTLSMMAFVFHLEWAKIIPEVLTYALIPLVIGIAIMFAGPPLIARKITSELERFYQKRKDLVSRADAVFKDAVQRIIDSIIQEIKNGNLEVKKKKEYKFGLFNMDYKGVKIVKKPSLFRKYYIVIPEF
jgi:ABC-type multidrug transport system fused ATPase/permease subunit